MLTSLPYIGLGIFVSVVLSTLVLQKRNVELQLRRLNEVLERRVQQRTERLAKTNDDLRTELEEYHRTTSALRKSQERKSTIIETALDCIVSTDGDGRVIEFNPAAELSFGYTKQQIKGKPITILLRADQERKAQQIGLRRYLQQQAGLIQDQRVETHCRRIDQSEFLVELSMVRVDDETNLSYTFYVRNITNRKRIEEERAQLTQDLVNASHRAGMAEIANGVLHNVGNVLNSINVSAGIVADRIRKSELDDLRRVAQLLKQQGDDLDEHSPQDSQAQQLANYLVALAAQLESEKQSVLQEFESLKNNVVHIREIIGRQQSYACGPAKTEPVELCELIDNALAICNPGNNGIEVRRIFDAIPTINIDKHSVMQVLVNLIENAKDALLAADQQRKCITVSVSIAADQSAQITIEDNGVGIDANNLSRLFHYAFTTKQHGHGFGLHASAAAVECMHGSLTASSGGPEQGASFVLKLPPSQAVSAA